MSETSGTGVIDAQPGIAPASAAKLYKAEQRRAWDGAARHMQRWWIDFERMMAPVTRDMLAQARLRRGAYVVDVASGFGEPALTAARAVGPTGRVVATDLSPEMLSVAAERTVDEGLDNVEIAVMDAEEPTLPRGLFDAVMCRLGLMFLPQLDLALRRLASLLVPGGRLVAAVWGRAEANEWLAVGVRTLAEYLELPPPPAEARGLFDLGSPGVVEDALEKAGLTHVGSRRVQLVCEWTSPQAYSDFHRSSPMRRLVAAEEPARRAEAWQEVTRAAARRWGRGPLRLTGEIVVVGGTRIRK